MIYHIVIQTTEGRKNLEDILVDIFVDVPEIFRLWLNNSSSLRSDELFRTLSEK